MTDAKHAEESPYLILGTKEGVYSTDLQKPWRRQRKGADLEHERILDFLRTLACEAVMGGGSLSMVRRILGNTQAQTTARYANLADDPLQRACDRGAASLKQAMEG
ncbi:MAG: hypothetical protein OXK82_10885 [Deltaproteobacteria bacterium]|nr:hypothetical protein [Deltaproteobacteria bacterium]